MSLRFVAKSVIQLISCDICFSIRSSDAAHLESWRIQIFRVKMEKKKHANSQGSSISTFLQLSLCLFLKKQKTSTKKTSCHPSPPLGLHHSLSGGFTFRRRWCYRLRCLGNYLLVLWGCVIVRLLILHRDANHLRLGLIAWGNLWQPTTHLGGAFKKNGTYILYDMYIYVYTSPYDL